MEFYKSDNLVIRFKRAIEQLKLYDSYPDSYDAADVKLTAINDFGKCHYCVWRRNSKYVISRNIEGGCRSLTRQENLDLDDIFTWFDKIQQESNEVIFSGLTEPRRYMSTFELYLHNKFPNQCIDS